MRFSTLATLFLGTALAIPSQSPSQRPCCCCDIGRLAIACTYTIAASECVCADVVCPANAKTVYDDKPPTAPTAPPSRPTPTRSNAASKLMGPATPVKNPRLPPCSDLPKSAGAPCCCCDIGKFQISCALQPVGDCFCAAVECPAGAPLVWTQKPVPCQL